jgi:hypothetical protein
LAIAAGGKVANSDVLLRSLLRFAILTFAILFLLWVAVWISMWVTVARGGNLEGSTLLRQFAQQLGDVTAAGWDFVRPILQLLLILLVLDWVRGRLGVSMQAELPGIDRNASTIVTLVVVGAFAVAALAGSTGASALRDVAFVVIGFFFGTQRTRNPG